MDIIPNIGDFVYYDSVRTPVLVADTDIGESCFTGTVYDNGKPELQEKMQFCKIIGQPTAAEIKRFIKRQGRKFHVNETALMAAVNKFDRGRIGCY